MSKKPADKSCIPTAYDNFVYLLHEMERAVERGLIQWPAGAKSIIRRRLATIVRKLAEPSVSAPPYRVSSNSPKMHSNRRKPQPKLRKRREPRH